MPITRSAKKALRGSLSKRVINDRRRRSFRKSVKEVEALAKEKKGKEADAKLREAFKAIDKAAKRGVIKKNTAARKKSRLVKHLRKAAA